MPTRTYYLQQSKLLRDMAAATSEPSLAGSWRKRAHEYEVLAESMGDDGGSEPISFEWFEAQPRQPISAPEQVRKPQRQQEQQHQQRRATARPAARTPPKRSSE